MAAWLRRACLYRGLDRWVCAAGIAACALPTYLWPVHRSRFYRGALRRQCCPPDCSHNRYCHLVYLSDGAGHGCWHYHEPLSGRELSGRRAAGAGCRAVLFVPRRHARDYLDASGAVCGAADRLFSASDHAFNARNEFAPATTFVWRRIRANCHAGSGPGHHESLC